MIPFFIRVFLSIKRDKMHYVLGFICLWAPSKVSLKLKSEFLTMERLPSSNNSMNPMAPMCA